MISHGDGSTTSLIFFVFDDFLNTLYSIKFELFIPNLKLYKVCFIYKNNNW
jgi:hypothetical protein